VTQDTQSGHPAPTTGDNFYLFEITGNGDDQISFYLIEGTTQSPTSPTEPTGTKLKQGGEAFNFSALQAGLQTKEYTFVADGSQLNTISTGDYTVILSATLLAN